MLLLVCSLSALLVSAAADESDQGTLHVEGDLDLKLDSSQHFFIPSGQCSGRVTKEVYGCLDYIQVNRPKFAPDKLSVEVLDFPPPAVYFSEDMGVVDIWRHASGNNCRGSAKVTVGARCPDMMRRSNVNDSYLPSIHAHAQAHAAHDIALPPVLP